MASYIMAMTINPSAKKAHPDLSHQVNKSLDVFSESGIKITSLFATLGRYDYIAVFDADDQKLAFRVASEINTRGILETETWPVIPYQEYTALIG